MKNIYILIYIYCHGFKAVAIDVFYISPMPYLKIWIHLVWSTKNREPLLTKAIRFNVFTHIKENALTKDIYVDCVNGYTDHIHCLIQLKAEQNIAKVVQLIKGESSYWINKHNLCATKFEWQDEYFASSISHSMVEQVRQYIHNQEKHHTTKTFDKEFAELMNKYGFEIAGR